VAAEIFGDDPTAHGAKAVPHGPTIEAWDRDGVDEPSNVEIVLEEEDESLVETTSAVNRNVTIEQQEGVRTRSRTRSNPIPDGMIELTEHSGSVYPEVERGIDIIGNDPIPDPNSVVPNPEMPENDPDFHARAGQPDMGVELSRDEIEVDPHGEVLDPSQPIPTVVEDSVFYYEYFAFLATMPSAGKPSAKLSTTEESNPEWRAMIAINPDENEELTDHRNRNRRNKHDPCEHREYDPLLAYMGINMQCPGSTTMMDTAFNLIAEVEPTSYAEAMQRWDWKKWKEATDKELQALHDMKCYKLAQLPPGKKLIKSRIVYKLKLDRDGTPLRYKARVVAKGFQQRYGVDYVDTYAATAHPTAVRLMLALAAQNGWLTNSTDIRNAFITAPIGQQDVYVQPPPGFERDDGQVWLLQKSLYGLTTSSRAFNKLLVDKMKLFGFTPTTADECCWSYVDANGECLHVLTVVDDMIQVGSSRALLDRFLDFLRKHFEITDDGEVNWFLGVAYNRDDATGNIHATQTAYVDRALEKFGFQNDNEHDTAMETNFRVNEDDMKHVPSESDQHTYRSMIGTLMYLAVWTRPDIAQAVNLLARYVMNASKRLMKAARNVFRYLKQTRTWGITFFRQDPITDETATTGLKVSLFKGHKRKDKLLAFSDASDADDPLKRRSTGGYLVTYNGSPVSWSSGLQRLTTLSTC